MKTSFVLCFITSVCCMQTWADPTVEIVVQGQRSSVLNVLTIGHEAIRQPDSAALLKALPGVDLNSNGPVTGIVQYRGLYGDRVAVSMENEPVLSGGPNAMDAPLSYAPPLLLKTLNLTTGIASVADSQESIGGHVRVNLDRGEFTNTAESKLSGAISSQYRSIDDGANHALRVVAANRSHKLSVLGSYDGGGNAETGNGQTLIDTGYQRQRYDLGYAWRDIDSGADVSLGKLDTKNSGTPALPMDIIDIDSDIANFNGFTEYNNLLLRARMGYRHVDHLMDNFSLRSAMTPADYRQNKATGQQFAWGSNVEFDIDNDSLTLGIDGTQTRHSAFITNPNMALFGVKNFADARRDIYGIFAQWQSSRGPWDVETGLRYNHIKMNSGGVFARGMMPMMQAAADALATHFNDDEREQSFNNIDIVFNAHYPMSDATGLNIGLGRKTRAPSYQELFLWLPLEATGGLADGRTYIGNLALDSEISHEATLGLDWRQKEFYANGQIFVRRINDFIQGTPSSNMTANMLSVMMSGQAPLQFNNIDAQLYGFDGRYGLTLNNSWRLDGVLSYIRGKDRDNGDNLYRIAPLNHRLTLTWQQDKFSTRLESVLYARQHDTSSYNNEQKTAGYGLLNLLGQYQPTASLRIGVGIENLLDQNHSSHLAGYNRNADSDIAVNDRLPGNGRNFFASISMSW